MNIEAFRKFDLTGRTALVTGGSAGIGYHMARGLARSGARVMIAARRESVLKDAAARLTADAFGNAVGYCPVDLGDSKSVEALARHAIDAMGGVDIFVGNAALFAIEPVDAITDDMMNRQLQVNIAANVQLARAFLPRMRANKWGRLIFSSSISAIRGSGSESASSIYSAVKGALNSYARAAATETGHDGITVNTIGLGPFATEMWHDMRIQLDKEHGPGAGQALENSLASMTAIGRLARCEEVEGLIQLLASDAGSYFTGANLALDGGLSAMMRPAQLPT